MSNRRSWGGAPAAPQAPARFGGGYVIPRRRVPYSGLVPYWEQTGLSLLSAPVRVTCARISSYRAAVCACIRRFKL